MYRCIFFFFDEKHLSFWRRVERQPWTLNDTGNVLRHWTENRGGDAQHGAGCVSVWPKHGQKHPSDCHKMTAADCSLSGQQEGIWLWLLFVNISADIAVRLVKARCERQWHKGNTPDAGYSVEQMFFSEAHCVGSDGGDLMWSLLGRESLGTACLEVVSFLASPELLTLSRRKKEKFILTTQVLICAVSNTTSCGRFLHQTFVWHLVQENLCSWHLCNSDTQQKINWSGLQLSFWTWVTPQLLQTKKTASLIVKIVNKNHLLHGHTSLLTKTFQCAVPIPCLPTQPSTVVKWTTVETKQIHLCLSHCFKHHT